MDIIRHLCNPKENCGKAENENVVVAVAADADAVADEVGVEVADCLLCGSCYRCCRGGF